MTDQDSEMFEDDPTADEADRYGYYVKKNTDVFARSSLAPLFKSGVYNFDTQRSFKSESRKNSRRVGLCYTVVEAQN